MKPFMLQLVMSTMLWVSCLGVNEDLLPNFHILLANEDAEVTCPPCELLFRNLQPTGKNGKLAQVTKVQERGEPKSGTGLMYDWASGSLMWTCHYLQQLFGKQSCQLHFTIENKNGLSMGRAANRTMIFEPALAGSGARCSCDAVDRVSIVLSRADKHRLPVERSCAYSHKSGIELAPVANTRHPPVFACKFADGSHVKGYDDLWRCMHEASCDVIDDWLQMAIFRDPRPAVVSAFFHVVKNVHLRNGEDHGTLEAFIARELPILCQWLAVRYILFSEFLPHQSVNFWYTDAIADPLGWHYRWFGSVGLQLPFRVVEATAKAAAANNFGFHHKAIDTHPGEEPRTETGARRFEDEVRPEVVEAANIVLRAWLPPVLLERFGVAPRR